MESFLFTSESVAAGHPDKIADQIADAILDAYLSQDPLARVACEVVVTRGIVFITGEITSTAHVDHEKIARNTIQSIGYCDCRLGFDYRSCGVINSVNEQSPDIAKGIGEGDDLGAGDQGLVFGFACDETPELMPLPIQLSHQIVRSLKEQRDSKALSFLRPDGKAQVTIKYQPGFIPTSLHAVVLSAQHDEEMESEEVVNRLKDFLLTELPKDLINDETLFYINPTGRFVIGGPVGDSGLTGRKTIVDTYGGMAHHGGGAFSGKDPTKLDRSASYAARYVAKNIVASGLARRCEVQISYAIGVTTPIAIKVDTFGTSSISESHIASIIPKVFDLTPHGIISSLDLRKPIYSATSFGGHFGQSDSLFPWEQTDRIEEIIKVSEEDSD